jgi:Beta-lactamase enzyme family
MKRLARTAFYFAAICLFSFSSTGQLVAQKQEIRPAKDYKPLQVAEAPELRTLLSDTINEVMATYPADTFRPVELAATLIDLRDPNNIKAGNIYGDVRIYPASVVKMFYLAALERQIEDGEVTVTPELRRGEHDMIVDSSNEATQYILDVLTGTSSGAELPKKDFDAWQYKRNRVNRYYSALGYTNINVNQKTFCEDAYGIEQQSRNYKGENRNGLTTNATARLLAEIVLGRVAGPAGTQQMLTLLKRDPFAAPKTGDEDQAHDFSGRALIDAKMTGARLWSKAGWTSKARHDAAYIETANGHKFVLVIFSENHATDKKLIPAIVGKVIARFDVQNLFYLGPFANIR